MKPSFYSSYFQFSKSQRSGIFIFLSCAVVFQVLYFWIDFKTPTESNAVQEKHWLSHATTSDATSGYAKKKQFVVKHVDIVDLYAELGDSGITTKCSIAGLAAGLFSFRTLGA